MKQYIIIRNNFALLISFCLIAIVGCDEQKRVIEPFIPAGNRIVLLEEFTGKGCTNCPKGSREIENLLTLFPNNLVAVSIHAGFFANPQFFPIGQYDFRTEEGEILFDYLGPNLGYPSGVVNRIPISGNMQIGANAWASAISNEIQKAPAIELTIIKSFDPVSRALTVTVGGIAKEPVAGNIQLSIMLTESGVIDAQDDAEATPHIVPDYEHKHLLRDMMTPVHGAPILTSISTGQTFSETFSVTLDPSWVAENMEIIAFVSRVEGSDFPVLQVVSAHVTE
ncbi:MAG: Omp28-related outer membrane protein [Saprospiraceae bacterium]